MSPYSPLNNLINIQRIQREHLCPARNNKDKKVRKNIPDVIAKKEKAGNERKRTLLP